MEKLTNDNTYKTSVKDGKTTVSIRENYEDESSKSLDVRECENGWIIKITHNHYEGEGDKREWKWEEKEYISAKNPIEQLKSKDTENEEKAAVSTKDVAASISGFLANMTNTLSL